MMKRDNKWEEKNKNRIKNYPRIPQLTNEEHAYIDAALEIKSVIGITGKIISWS